MPTIESHNRNPLRPRVILDSTKDSLQTSADTAPLSRSDGLRVGAKWRPAKADGPTGALICNGPIIVDTLFRFFTCAIVIDTGTIQKKNVFVIYSTTRRGSMTGNVDTWDYFCLSSKTSSTLLTIRFMIVHNTILKRGRPTIYRRAALSTQRALYSAFIQSKLLPWIKLIYEWNYEFGCMASIQLAALRRESI